MGSGCTKAATSTAFKANHLSIRILLKGIQRSQAITLLADTTPFTTKGKDRGSHKLPNLFLGSGDRLSSSFL